VSSIVITGGSGQLGQCLKKLLPDALYPTRHELDLSSPQSIETYLNKVKADLVINCAAYTQVDKAESERALANQINHHAPALMASLVDSIIHFSTDYVFNGKAFRPYQETDLIDPINYYGETKALGEKAIQTHCSKHFILRTSWLYADQGVNFKQTMLRLGRERDQIKVVSDQIGTPTKAMDLAQFVTEKLILTDNYWQTENYGIYHFSNLGVASWYDFAHAIIKAAKLNCEVLPIRSEDYPTPAKRPFYSVLDKSKLINTFEYSLPHWRDSL